ncbi:MAG: ADP-dependent glucokinase/phosphofructokinase [bacterium]
MSNAAHWEQLYDQAYTRGMERISQINGVACAFHSVIDGFIRLTPDLLRPVLERDSTLKQAALAGCKGEPPLEILSPQDFIQGMFYSLYRGSALQRMIRSEETYQWVLDTFGSGELRLGGTSANMARALTPLDIPVTIYANPLTVELAELFGDFDNLHVIRKKNGQFTLETPRQAAEEHGVFAIHWIFEFGTDFEMELDGVVINPHRANRYIPSWNPRNNQFTLDPVFAEGFLNLADQHRYLFFSGFHILSETYLDGSTCDDVIRPLGEYLDQLRQRSPELIIHLELASIASLKVRRAVLNHVMNHVHSIGLNETELPLMLELFGDTLVQDVLKQEPNVFDYANACMVIMSQTGLQRIHFHNLGYYLCLEKKAIHTPQDTRDSLLFAAIMAAARAKNGLFHSREDIQPGLEPPISEIGLRETELLAMKIDEPGIAEEGIGTFGSLHLSIIPTKLVPNPLFTVGLGDTISTGALLTE